MRPADLVGGTTELSAASIDWAIGRFQPLAVPGSAATRPEQRSHGRALLRALLRRRGYTDDHLERSETGRPIILDRPEVSMSVSYDRGIVLAALTEERSVGVDVESISRAPAGLRSILNVGSTEYAADHGVLFARRWTQLEATAKARDVTLRSLIAELRRGRRWEDVCDLPVAVWQSAEMGVAWTIGVLE
jgi:hypothetical protein